MGLWARLFSSDGDGETTRVRQNSEDNAKVRGDKLTHHGSGHEHDSYKLDTASGNYQEYHGGENASDRGYN